MAIQYESNFEEVQQQMKRAMEKALESVGLYIEGQAKLLSPVDTARLKNSINHSSDVRQKRVTIGTNVEYAIYQEFGTRKMRAQSYLRPAAERNKATIASVAKDAYSEVIGR